MRHFRALPTPMRADIRTRLRSRRGSVTSMLFSPAVPSRPPGSATDNESKERGNALAALADWQDAYLQDPGAYSDFLSASTIPPEHMLRDLQLTRAIAEGAQYLGGPCSHGVDPPTKRQDRYEYIILARLVEELRLASSQQNVPLPSNVV